MISPGRRFGSAWPQTTLAAVLMLRAIAVSPTASSAAEEAIYDESRVPAYTLPDPLVTSAGHRVASREQWIGERRPELLRLFETQVYGRAPTAVAPRAETIEQDETVFAGQGQRRLVRLHLGDGPAAPAIEVAIFTPRGQQRSPLFLGLRLFDKQAREPMPGQPWTPSSPAPEAADNSAATTATSPLPGPHLGRFLLEQGFGFASLTPEDFAPDDKQRFRDGIIATFADPGRDTPADEGWGSISAWGWALSRTLDYFQTDPAVDPRRVIVIGHSRMGKTALWAAAQDPRFAIAISNNSGCGGAALSKRIFGETVGRINTVFPHWFCGNFKRYNGREAELPVDQHELLALIAPRPVYVASALDDGWADPRGEFLAAVHAAPVYELLGERGLGTDTLPPVNQPIGDTIGYHLRTGKHSLTDYDWVQYVAFAQRHFAASATSAPAPTGHPPTAER